MYIHAIGAPILQNLSLWFDIQFIDSKLFKKSNLYFVKERKILFKIIGQQFC